MDTAACTEVAPQFSVRMDHHGCPVTLLFHPAMQCSGLPPCSAQVLLRAAKTTPMASSGGGALSYLANEASYDDDEVETARERIAALAARVEGRPLSPMARRMAAVKGYAIGLFEIVLALIYKVRVILC